MSLTNAKIILNRETLNILFPEGSEARIELQKSVINEYSKKLMIDIEGNVARDIKGQLSNSSFRSNYINEVVKDFKDTINKRSMTRGYGIVHY